MVNAQEWLDKNYPKGGRSEVSEIYLNEPNLAGELDLGDFTYVHRISVYIFSQVDENKLTFKNLPKNFEIIPINAQRYINYHYLEDREKVTELNISGRKLEGDLNLLGFINLKGLYCYSNKLTFLNVSRCPQLEKFWCNDNLLTEVILPTNSTNLVDLWLHNNNFSATQELSFLSKATNLEILCLGNRDYGDERINQGIYNRFTGSLDYLSGMEKLKELGIGNTDLNEVNLDKLPRSLEKIEYSTKLRPDCKLTAIVPQLNIWTWKDLHSDFVNFIKANGKIMRIGWEKLGFNKEQTKEWINAGTEPKDYNFVNYLKRVKKFTPQEFLNSKNKEGYQNSRKRCNKFDWCRQCQQPNTSRNWCHPCADQEWKRDIKNLTGQELVEKFIEQQQKIGSSIYKLQWIPYEKFTNIEYLAEGGFSKIYKAKWQREKKYSWDKIPHDFVLKVINNSQNINLELLTEIANSKLVDGSSHIVECCGISQDHQTKNYLLVMYYMEGGNLREYLQKSNKDLSFYDKIHKLMNITFGLKCIHGAGLVHRDLHSGNILNDVGAEYKFSSVTDLGLCQPANYQKEESKIYGVFPYVAPEVLKGQPYTYASDIYSFGIIAYELLANSYPYLEMDNLELSLKVCRGLRPDIDKVPIPQLLKDLIKRCWDAEPQNRPRAKDLDKIIISLYNEMAGKKNTPFYQQFQGIAEQYNTFSKNSYQIHPTAVTTSKMIDTKQITERLKTYSEDLIFDFTKLNLEEQEQSAHIEIPPK